MALHDEILEQYDVLKNLLSSQKNQVEKIAAEIKRRNIEYVFLAARGTSDNAGRYANYLWGAYNQLPLALATPSLFSIYDRPPRLKNALVVGISQSGKSPDIVSVIAEGKRQGCLTLSITNEADSPLAAEADFVLDVKAGVEKAVAATKTYTAQLTAVAMLSAALADDQARWKELDNLPGWVETVLKLDEKLAYLSTRYRYMQRCVVLGRGFNYATAFEWSLKMKELTYIEAEPYSSADFMHGPIAMVDQGFPVMVVNPSGKVYDSLLPLMHQLREVQQAELAVISDQPEALALAQTPIPLPAGIPEWISPIVSIIPGQLFGYHLTLHRGLNTEAPRRLSKVTETN
ncbi:MAG: SIS domain-containing protein [Anaerolineae bacterium]|nr:SIS domain-containing protein [Anaerolineae bacterium]